MAGRQLDHEATSELELRGLDRRGLAHPGKRRRPVAQAAEDALDGLDALLASGTLDDQRGFGKRVSLDAVPGAADAQRAARDRTRSAGRCAAGNLAAHALGALITRS